MLDKALVFFGQGLTLRNDVSHEPHQGGKEQGEGVV
jgi:hypothetical protein